MTNDVGQSI